MRVQLTLHTAGGDVARSGAEIDVELRAPQMSCLIDLAPMMCSAVGAQPDATISVSGRPLPSSAVIGTAELVSGARLTIGRTGSREPALASALQLRVVGGPDAGHMLGLPRGSTTIGRSGGADLVLRDADISRLHAEVRVDYDGIWVRDLGSTNGTAVAGERIGGGEAAMPIGDFLNIGSSTLLVVGSAEPPATTRQDPGGLVSVYRASRIQRGTLESIVDFPPTTSDQPRPRLALMAVLLPTLLSVGLAAAMRNPQLLAFALLTPITVLSTAASDRWTWRRSSRAEKLKVKADESAAEARLLAAVAEEVAYRRRQFADPAAITQAVMTRNCRLWERRRTDTDFLEVGLGLADQSAHCHGRRAGIDLAPSVQSALPATLRLAMGPLGLAGPLPLVGGSARWIVCQVVALHSPQDVDVQLLLGAAQESWRWLRWLPSCKRIATCEAEHRELIGELNDEIARRSAIPQRHPGGWQGPWTLVIVDPSRSFAALPGMASLLERGPTVGITAICVDDNPRALPSACRTIAQYDADSGNMLHIIGAGSTVSGSITADRVSLHFADTLSRGLAPLRDAEADPATRLPDRVRLTDLLELADYDPRILLDRWACATAPSVPIGVTGSGPLSIDLIADGPHVLIAGSTGSGKSELLRSLVAGLAADMPPDALSFVLIDYKGGAAFAACADLPHTAAVVTDLDHHLTKRALISLDAELRRREAAFSAAGVSDLVDYVLSSEALDSPVSRLVLVVDEFAALVEELPEFIDGLVGIAQRGRSLGVHLVLATQRPAGVVSAEIKANTALRFALRMTDPSESIDVIGFDGAARIPKASPGRGYVQVARGVLEFQAAQVGVSPDPPDGLQLRRLDTWNRLMDDSEAMPPNKDDLAMLRDATCSAARRRGRAVPPAPWLAPLPSIVTVQGLAATAGTSAADVDRTCHVILGLADEPAAQKQTVLTHNLERGGTIGFIGAPRSGRTSVLRTIIAQAAAAHSAADLHCYVLDCAAGSLQPLAELPHCGAVVTRHDPGSVTRLVERLYLDIAERQQLLTQLGVGSAAEARSLGLKLPWVICAVNGWEGLVALSDDVDGGRTVDTMLQVMRDAAAAGYTVLLAGDRALLGIRIAATLERKFVLELLDRSDFGMAGIPAAALPRTFSAGRAICAEDSSEVQFALLAPDPQPLAQWQEVSRVAAAAARPDPASRPMQVRPLPNRISAAEIRPGIGMALLLLLGVGGDAAEPVTIDLLGADRRFLVTGPPRSGRSTTLITIGAQAVRLRQPVIVVAGERSPLSSWARHAGIGCHDPAAQDSTELHRCIDDEPQAIVLVDDAEELGDTSSDLLIEVAARYEHPMAVTVRSDDLQISFRGLAVDIRRHRTGLLLQPTGADAELLAIRSRAGRSLRAPGSGLLVTAATREGWPDGLPVQVMHQ